MAFQDRQDGGWLPMYELFTHNDLDGVGCGIVARCAFGDKVEIRYNSVSSLNGQVARFLERQLTGKKQAPFVFITDLSVNEDNEARIHEFVERGGQAKLIDHHKTALHLAAHSWGVVQVEYQDGRLASATSLFYEYLLANGLMKSTPVLDTFVELVRLYDTWEWETHDNQQAKRLNELFYMVSIDEFEAKMKERIEGSEQFFFDEFEQKILDMEEEKIIRYVRRKKREIVQTFIGEHCVGVVHAESYHSELGNELGKENPHMDYIVILNVGGRRVSFRTIHDDPIDVSEIAGKYGGGGHAKAAGCSLEGDLFRLYVAEPFALEPMQPDAGRNHYNLKGAASGSLYENRDDDTFWIYPFEGMWKVDQNGEPIEFTTFAEAERYVKRHHTAWLARDEAFFKFLSEYAIETKNASLLTDSGTFNHDET
jgi:oligoribonuclease NrnB/cAMP/cGMP phosphodiesterase (DHH superfamily)